jgi:hypothetical protein
MLTAPQIEGPLLMQEMEDSNSRDLPQPTDATVGSQGERNAGNLNFVIAPTISMKTKANFRPNSIAPTILMILFNLSKKSARSHDLIEREGGYRNIQHLGGVSFGQIQVKFGHFSMGSADPREFTPPQSRDKLGVTSNFGSSQFPQTVGSR